MGSEVLNVVGEDRAPGAPYGSSARARAFVGDTLEKIHIDDPASMKIVELLGEIVDELAECRATLVKEGQFIKDRFGKPKQHPAAQREIALLNEYGKLYRLLGLDQEPRDQGHLDFQ